LFALALSAVVIQDYRFGVINHAACIVAAFAAAFGEFFTRSEDRPDAPSSGIVAKSLAQRLRHPVINFSLAVVTEAYSDSWYLSPSSSLLRGMLVYVVTTPCATLMYVLESAAFAQVPYHALGHAEHIDLRKAS
jgi:hypothetical protein